MWDLVLPIAIDRRLGDGSCISQETQGELSSGLRFLDSVTDNISAFRIPCNLTDAEWKERFGFVPIETPPFCTEDSGTFGELRRRLAAAGLMPTRGVYLTTYPAEPFSANSGDVKGGCGIFSSISKDEAQFMSHWGHQLNKTIHGEAVGNGFFSVPGITRAFRKHGYCAGQLQTGMFGSDGQPVVVGSKSYFVGLTESIARQSGIDGTIHPNRLGHEAIREALLAAIAARKPDRIATHRVTVIVERLRFDTPQGNDIKVSAEFSAMPLERPATDEDDVDFRDVRWKQVLEFRDFDAVPGQWRSLDQPLRLQVSAAPSDVRISFVAFAKVMWRPKDNCSTACTRRPDAWREATARPSWRSGFLPSAIRWQTVRRFEAMARAVTGAEARWILAIMRDQCRSNSAWSSLPFRLGHSASQANLPRWVAY